MLRCLRIIRLSSAKDYATKPTVMSRLNNYCMSIGSGLNHEPPIGKTATNNRLGQACNLKRFFTVTATLWTRLWPKQFSIHSKAPAEAVPKKWLYLILILEIVVQVLGKYMTIGCLDP